MSPSGLNDPRLHNHIKLLHLCVSQGCINSSAGLTGEQQLAWALWAWDGLTACKKLSRAKFCQDTSLNISQLLRRAWLLVSEDNLLPWRNHRGGINRALCDHTDISDWLFWETWAQHSFSLCYKIAYRLALFLSGECMLVAIWKNILFFAMRIRNLDAC